MIFAPTASSHTFAEHMLSIYLLTYFPGHYSYFLSQGPHQSLQCNRCFLNTSEYLMIKWAPGYKGPPVTTPSDSLALGTF